MEDSTLSEQTCLRVLLLSAYDAVSHRYWREGLVDAFAEHKWEVQTLPPRYFNWRIRGNSLTWAFNQQEVLTQAYDLVIATSMTDLATLRGLVPSLAQCPTILYFHENQFAYPQNDQAHGGLEARMVTLYSALAADHVLFNSDYNRVTYITGVETLLKKLPDGVPPDVVSTILNKSAVLAVPLRKRNVQMRAEKSGNSCFTILWNHRWEYDKAPDRFFAALVKLKEAGINFKVNVVGQQFRQQPDVFEQHYIFLKDHINAWGMVEQVRYEALLRESHVVVSTALHDFQGLAVLEAVAAGCVAAVPDRLAYQEYIDTDQRYKSFLNDPAQESQCLSERLISLAGDFAQGHLDQASDVSGLFWSQQKGNYQSAFRKAMDLFATGHTGGCGGAGQYITPAGTEVR